MWEQDKQDTYIIIDEIAYIGGCVKKTTTTTTFESTTKVVQKTTAIKEKVKKLFTFKPLSAL